MEFVQEMVTMIREKRVQITDDCFIHLTRLIHNTHDLCGRHHHNQECIDMVRAEYQDMDLVSDIRYMMNGCEALRSYSHYCNTYKGIHYGKEQYGFEWMSKQIRRKICQ